MDIFLQDPNEIPLPPEEVRIESFSAEPYPDQRRIRVKMVLTPFQKRPHIEIFIVDSEGKRLSEVSILESLTKNIDLTMHLRSIQPAGEYRIEAYVYYPQESQQEQEDPRNVPEPKIVDRTTDTFELIGR